MIDLYSAPTPNGHKISIALEEMNLPYNLINIDISKQSQSSDFGGELTPAQLKYCANDVIFLHKIHDELNKILIRENRINLYKKKKISKFQRL